VSWPYAPLHRIVCAVDGSETSLRAADAAIALAAPSQAELVFVHVLDDELIRDFATVMDDDGAEARQRLQRSADELLGHVAELAAKADVSVQCRLESGDPPHAVDQVARELGADVIVVGKIGRRGMRKWLVGSVTRRLIESTRIPVLVIAGPVGPPEDPAG
jgi:nucleotide-binding universal stress UspA family protein